MPVSTTSYKAGTMLEAAVLCDQHGLSYFKRIESTLQDLKGSNQDQPSEQTCSVEMMRKLITTIQEQLPCQRFWQVEIMVLVIKHIAVSTQEGESDNLSVLLDNGLTEMLVFVFEETRRHVSQNGREACPEADHLMEVLFETINDVAEYSGAARKLTVEAFCARLIKLVINSNIIFHTRMEAERTLNLLLEGCEDEDLTWVGEDSFIAKLMQHLAEFLPVAGDFEMQIAVTESLARMVTKSERKRRSPAWFPMGAISEAFLAIDDQQFDSDCRIFLNLLNKSCPGRSVYSYSCKQAFLGDYELKNPNEDKLSEFWVDFNTVSQSITMYVADEETQAEEEGGLWETVTFSKDKVKEYFVNEDEKGHMNLVISLTEPPSSLLASCGKDGRTATIVFKPRTDLADALATSIGLEKNAAPVETPTSSRRSSVSKINVLVNRARNTSWGLSNMPQSFNDGYVDGGANHEAQPGKAARPSGDSHANEAKATPVRRKISIPLVAMITPTRTSLHSSSSSGVSSIDKTPQSKATKQGFVQPRTPTGHHGSTKKVKTPLQVTVADKPSTSGKDSIAEHPKSLSTTPAKVSVTRNTVICKSPVVQPEREGDSPRLVPYSQEGAGADSLGILQEGAVQKKMRKGKSGGMTGEGDGDLEDQPKISSATKSAKEKKGLQNRDLGKASKKDGKTAQAQSKRSSREDFCEAGAVAGQDITDIPDTQSQSLISHDSEASQESHQSKGRKKGRKAATNPPSEGSKRTTRSSKAGRAQGANKASGLPQPLQPESNSRRGKRFKLYSETSLLMDSVESEDMNGGSKTRGKGTKVIKGRDKASDTVRETEEHAVTTSKGKGVRTKKGKKKEEKEDLPVTEDQHYKSDEQAESTRVKPKGASKESRNDITGPLMIEDNLSQDFVVPKATVKGKPTRGVIDLTEDKMTSGGLMYNPDPLEEEEHMTACLPQIDERAAAQALAAENAEYCVPSSAPEERCASSKEREEVIPDSQPQKNSFRRSGRFPSPLLSDITEESTMSKGSSGPKLGKRFQSPHASSQSEGASEPMVIKSRTKPETAKADSTSVYQDEKDPYDFVDSSTVSSLPVVSRKTPPKDGGGDADSAKAAKKQGGKAAGAKKGKGGSLMTAHQDVGVEESSHDEFVIHSHTFGFKNKGNGKSQGKSQQSAKGLKTSPESDHPQETNKAEDDDLMALEKPRQSSKRKMKGKLDSDDAYIQRIQRETKELAEFASRMQDQEEEFPDIEVARDVARVTEAYEDTNISTFVKSVMKSLPKHRKNKDILKNAIHGEGKTFEGLDKVWDGEVHVDEAGIHAEKEDLEDAEEHSHHRSRRSSSDSRKKSLKSVSRSRDAEVGDEQETSKPKKKVTSQADASRKEVPEGAKDKCSRKSTRRASKESMKGDESLTEGEISMDDMVSAHMESILGNKSDRVKESASRKADEVKVKERRMVPHMDEFEVDKEVLMCAEDSISRRSKMIVALEHSSVDLSDIEQNKEVEKIQGKRSVEREMSLASDGTNKRANRSSMSSIPGAQAPCAPASAKSSKGPKERQSKRKPPRLDQSDDGDMYDYERDLEELQASKKKTRQDKPEQQKDSFNQKSKNMKPKTTVDDAPLYSAKNRKGMRDSVDLEEARSGRVKPKAVTTMQETERSAAKSKVSKDSRRHFGSQIEESDSEEIMETETTTSPDDMSTVVSVASFSNMCKDLLKSSGKGIAAGRKKRNVKKVDYRESENSYSGSDDQLLDLQTPGRSTTKTTCEKPTRDIYEYREETSSCCTASFIEDAISERSWLADRPKQKVSTYSKTRREVFGLTKLTQNLDTVKKPRHKQQVKQNANAPKKRKSQSSKEAEEEEPPLYYYAEEEQEVKKAKKQAKRGTQGREHDDVDRVASRSEPLSKKPKSSCRRSLVECMSSMSSGINHMYDSSQDVRDEDDDGGDDNDGREEEEEVEEEGGRLPATPALTIEMMTSQMSTWSTPGSGTRTPRTPKQVSFVDELESLGSEREGDFEMECPVSGPSKSVRPSESTLKRKYANLLLDEDDEGNDEDDDQEEEDDEEEEEDALLNQGGVQRSKEKQRGLNLSLGQTSFLEPTVLFKANEPNGEAELSEHSGEDGISDHSISSSWGHNMDFPAMQMPEMFGFMRNRLKQKMMAKRNQSQQLTESAIQSTQKQMNKLFLELHKARQRSQNGFQDKLLTELVGMEGSLDKLAKIQAQNEHILKQYAKKSTQHTERHLSRVAELHAGFLEKSARLGENVVESLQHVINKEMKNMLKKMMQDMQQEQMKKTMQSLLLLR